jgi:hypothetical protein
VECHGLPRQPATLATLGVCHRGAERFDMAAPGFRVKLRHLPRGSGGLRCAVARRMLPVLMDSARRIRGPMRAGLLLLAVLVAVCATDLARPAMVMAGGESCVGPTCDDQIVCGPSAQPLISPGSSIQVVALPVFGERSLRPVKIEARRVEPPSTRVIRQSLVPLGSRSPPAA